MTKIPVLLQTKTSKDQMMEYLRFLAESGKTDYAISEEKFENLKKYFLTVAKVFESSSDFISLGFLIYFTQYFSTKGKKKEVIELVDEEKVSNPFADEDGEEEEKDFFSEEDELKNEEDYEIKRLSNEYFQLEILKNPEFWRAILGQFYNVIGFLIFFLELSD